MILPWLEAQIYSGQLGMGCTGCKAVGLGGIGFHCKRLDDLAHLTSHSLALLKLPCWPFEGFCAVGQTQNWPDYCTAGTGPLCARCRRGDGIVGLGMH